MLCVDESIGVLVHRHSNMDVKALSKLPSLHRYVVEVSIEYRRTVLVLL